MGERTDEDVRARRGTRLLDIQCATCGAPTEYNIKLHAYTCAYCGNPTTIEHALSERKGFRALHKRSLEERRGSFDAVTCNCSGCAATIVFPPNEVLQTCPFCGRALVRGNYLKTSEFPELLIPFRLTLEEAKERLEEWCARNRWRREAKHLRACLESIQGYYLPFELVRGPIDCSVSREGAARTYECGGFLTGIFVNTSSQLDNLTLNGMEPFDLRELIAFDFGYLAKQKAKVDEVGSNVLEARVSQEVASEYGKVVEQTLETRNVSIQPHTGGLFKMPVLLPVYYVQEGDVCVAVNGQTGKVAVRCEKERKTLPWWIRPIVATLTVFVASLLVALQLTHDLEVALWEAGAFTLVMGLIFYTAYSNAYEGEARRTLDPKIFTTREVFERAPDGSLRPSSERIVEEPVTPLFFEDVDGERTQVELAFTTPLRTLKMLLLGLAVMALPLILAFVINGMDFHGLNPVGAAIWLCIFVPVVPAYYVKFGRIAIYENPYVYAVDERGHKRRIRTKPQTNTVVDVAKLFLSPPLVFVSLALLLCLLMSVYFVLAW